ncbi:four-helix bundle copper-binding protein [Fischerella thermalis]|nr:four-helix bundle copper-binding protein [Fischerella thermalis]
MQKFAFGMGDDAQMKACADLCRRCAESCQRT